MSDFQTQVNIQPAPAVAGDFASSNPRASVLAGPGSLISGAAGVTVGRFAWAAAAAASDTISGETQAYNTVNNFGLGAPTGFVHRGSHEALITTFLASNTALIPAGQIMTLHSAGDFWVKNEGTAAATAGQKAYANNSTGQISFAATGTPTAGGSCTAGTLQKIVSASTGATLPITNTCTASIAGTTMTVSAITATMAVGPGQILTGTNVEAGTTVVAQLTGTTGSTGTYQVSISQTVTSTTITMSGGTMILTGPNTSGIFAVGQTLSIASSGSLTAGTTILSVLTGSGGAGIYLVNQVAATAVTAGTITASNAMYLTVDTSSTGVWGLDDLLTGASVTTGTAITATGAQNANLTGLGGAGTYLTNTYQTAIASQTFGTYTNVETKWICMSAGGVGELVKMSSWALG
jgi:hypothetical protein